MVRSASRLQAIDRALLTNAEGVRSGGLLRDAELAR
jgi:hypothetical protein